MRHVADSCFGCPVRRRRGSPIGSVRRHRGSEYNAAWHIHSNAFTGEGLSAEVCAVDVEVEEIVKLGACEVESRLVFGHACVGDEAVQGTTFGYYRVEGGGNGSFVSHIAVEVVQAVGVALRQSKEFSARFEEVQAVDVSGRVDKANFGYA